MGSCEVHSSTLPLSPTVAATDNSLTFFHAHDEKENELSSSSSCSPSISKERRVEKKVPRPLSFFSTTTFAQRIGLETAILAIDRRTRIYRCEEDVARATDEKALYFSPLI